MTKLLFSAALICSLQLNAQDSLQQMETDRPGQSSIPFTTARGFVQAEAGFSLERYKEGTDLLYYPSLVTKYGLGKRVELRLRTELTMQTTPVPGGKDEVVSGLLPVEIGAKLVLFEEKGWRPRTAVLVQSGVPGLSSGVFKQDRFTLGFRWMFRNSLSEKVWLNYNFGGRWDAQGIPTWFYTLAPGMKLGARWTAFVEYFGYLNSGNHPQHGFDGGLAFYINNDHKLDLSGGLGISPNTSLQFIGSLGYSFRLGNSR